MRWLPLESNPDVMNSWSSALGLSTDSVSFIDIYGLDDDLLSLVPQPIYAILMLFPISKEYEDYRKEENELMIEFRKKINFDQLQSLDHKIIFIKQTISNACGTIGLLHALANNPTLPIAKDATLSKFLEKCKSKTPEERARLLETDDDIANVHSKIAHSGQSRVPDEDEDVDLHFVCFVQCDGLKPNDPNRLIELDGRKSFPIDHGPIQTNLLNAVVPVVKKFMSLSKDNLQFNLIGLCSTA